MRLWIKLQLYSHPNFNQFCINVYNGGELISSEILPKLSQLFYSTQFSGIGLELAIVKRIVEVHGGELLIQSNVLEGAMVSG